MNKMQKTLFLSVLVSELGHIFCCVLPVLLSLLGLFSAFGILSLVPGFIWETHDFMHKWELVIISISAAFLAMGWGIAFYLQKNIDDSHNHCTDGHCAGQAAKRTKLILIFATVLFAFNFSVYLLVHKEGAPFYTDTTHQHHADAHGHIH